MSLISCVWAQFWMQLYISFVPVLLAMHACMHSLFSPILVLAIENKLTFQLFMFCFFKPVKNTWRRTLRGQATLTSCQSSWLTRPPFSFAFAFFSSPFIQFLPVSETLRHSFGGLWDRKLWDECHTQTQPYLISSPPGCHFPPPLHFMEPRKHRQNQQNLLYNTECHETWQILNE